MHGLTSIDERYTMTQTELDVPVLIEFYHIKNGRPRKVPGILAQALTVSRTFRIDEIRDWMTTPHTMVSNVLTKSKLHHITDIITSQYDARHNERILQFPTTSFALSNIWSRHGHAGLFPGREHWPWEPPKLYIKVDNHHEDHAGLVPHCRPHGIIRVKGYQEEAVLWRRLIGVYPLLDDMVRNLKPRQTSSPIDPVSPTGDSFRVSEMTPILRPVAKTLPAVEEPRKKDGRKGVARVKMAVGSTASESDQKRVSWADMARKAT